jgi:hypothetical protein
MSAERISAKISAISGKQSFQVIIEIEIEPSPKFSILNQLMDEMAARSKQFNSAPGNFVG